MEDDYRMEALYAHSLDRLFEELGVMMGNDAITAQLRDYPLLQKLVRYHLKRIEESTSVLEKLLEAYHCRTLDGSLVLALSQST